MARYRLDPLSIRETSTTALPVASATVTVYLAGTSTLATAYANTTTLTPLTGSQTTTNSSGYFEFFIDGKDYVNTQKFKIVISKTGYPDVTYDNLNPLPDLSGIQDPWVDVRAFGAVLDGVTDDTAAFDAAVAALPALGGVILIPAGKKCAVNLVFGSSKYIYLMAHNAVGASSTAEVGLVPYNTAQPVLKIGNDTAYLRGFNSDGVCVHSNGPNGHGTIGVELGGGAYEVDLSKMTIKGSFSQHNLKIQSGSTYAISYVWLNNLKLAVSANVNQTATLGIYYGATWVTAVFMNGFRITGPNGTGTGRAMILDSVALFAKHGWIQAANGKGILFQGTNPYLKGDGISIDSDNSADELVETTCTGDTSAPHTPNTRLRGGITVDGVMKLQNASTVSLVGQHYRFPNITQMSTPRLYAPYIVDATYLTTTASPTATDAYLARSTDNILLQNSTAAGTTSVVSVGNVFITTTDAASSITFKTTNTARWNISAAGELTPSTDNVRTLGTASLRPSAVYGTNLKPGAGTVTWTAGAGTPEGAATAAIGSLYTRTDGGAGTTLYIKESGTGNTGWVAK